MLRFGSCGVELPFLSESQIPADFNKHVEDVSEAEAGRRVAEGAAGERGLLPQGNGAATMGNGDGT